MSKISIVSNLQCTSIFTVRIDDDFASVLVWEQGSRTEQFNFHPLTNVSIVTAAKLRARMLESNLDAVMRRMERTEVPRDERNAFYKTFRDIIDGWVSDWFICNFGVSPQIAAHGLVEPRDDSPRGVKLIDGGTV